MSTWIISTSGRSHGANNKQQLIQYALNDIHEVVNRLMNDITDKIKSMKEPNQLTNYIYDQDEYCVKIYKKGRNHRRTLRKKITLSVIDNTINMVDKIPTITVLIKSEEFISNEIQKWYSKFNNYETDTKTMISPSTGTFVYFWIREEQRFTHIPTDISQSMDGIEDKHRGYIQSYKEFICPSNIIEMAINRKGQEITINFELN